MYNHKAYDASPSPRSGTASASTWGTCTSSSSLSSVSYASSVASTSSSAGYSYESTPPLSPLILPPNGFTQQSSAYPTSYPSHPSYTPSHPPNYLPNPPLATTFLISPHPSLTLSHPSLRSFTISSTSPSSSSTPLHPTPSHPATHPPTTHLRLLLSIHPSWTFSLYALSEVGYVTIQDVLFGLVSFLHKADRGDVEKSRVLGLGNLGIGLPSTLPYAQGRSQSDSYAYTPNTYPTTTRSSSSQYPLGQRTYEARDAQLRRDPSAPLTRLALLGGQTTFLGLSPSSGGGSEATLVIHLR